MRFPWWAAWAVTAVGLVGYAGLWLWGDRLDAWMLQVGVVGFGYPFLVGTSGLVWDVVDGLLNDDPANEEGTDRTETADGGTLGEEGRADVDVGDGTRRDGEDAGPPAVGAGAGRADEHSGPDRDVGFVVGKCENVLILTFMVVGAYTALAVIFAAKSIVRREDMKNDSKYYLAGTITNVTYSVLVGAGVRVALRAFDAWPIAFLGAG